MTTVTPVATTTPTPGVMPSSAIETWEMRVDGTIYLTVLKPNRFNQVIEEQIAIGPNRKGHRFQLSQDDRLDNQRRVASVEHDVFKNGMLIRVDADQQQDVETQSNAVLTDEQYLDILDLPEDAFREKVATLPEIPVRGLRALAEGAGASHNKVVWLDEHIRDRFMPGGPQTAIQDGGTAERLS